MLSVVILGVSFVIIMLNVVVPSVVMLNVMAPYSALCTDALLNCFAECRYPECHYAECRGAIKTIWDCDIKLLRLTNNTILLGGSHLYQSLVFVGMGR